MADAENLHQICNYNQEMKSLLGQMVTYGELVKRNSEQKKQILKQEVKKLEEVIQTLSGKENTISNQESESLQSTVSSLQDRLAQVELDEERRKKEVQEAEQELAGMKKQLFEKQQSTVTFPKARYSVNLYRDISKINWQTEHQENEVKGFICNTYNTRTFRFDVEKQSQFFITNTLWAMGDSSA